MSSMFLRTENIHKHKLRNQNAYYIRQIRTNTRKSTINFSGPKIWNTLPANLRQLVSIHQFKKKFKQLLLTKFPQNGLTKLCLYSNLWLRILIMSFLFKTRGLYIQTYPSLVTIASTLAMTTYFSIKSFNLELLSRFFMRRHRYYH